ncbi:MAG: hypothetical protein MUE92_02335 [Chloroflexi bacterium]|nr:hypothetical protein [Chloroflexota bacterium]
MPRSSRIRHAIFAATAAALLLPAAAQAAPSGDSCAAYTSIPFVADVPDALRTLGTHRYEWRVNLTLPDGTAIEDVRGHQVEISTDAAVYPNPVYLQLTSTTTVLRAQEEVEVAAMRPDQAAAFRVGFFAPKDEPAMLDSARLAVRYETGPGAWSEWSILEPGPRSSTCSAIPFGFVRRSYGWAD